MDENLVAKATLQSEKINIKYINKAVRSRLKELRLIDYVSNKDYYNL